MRQSTACQQCGRLIVPDASGAGTCASCGWALPPIPASAAGPTDASTQALPTGAATSRVSEIAALATRPARLAEDDSATRPAPMAPPVSALERTAALPAARTMAALPPTPTGAESRWRTWGMIAVVVALLAIIAVAALVANGTLALGGASATPTAQSSPTPTLSPTTPAGFKPYVAPEGYQLNIPATWAAVPFQTNPTSAGGATGAGTIFEDVSNHNQFAMMIFSGTSLPTPQLADDQALNQLSAGKPMRNRQPPDTMTLAGQTWTREMADLPVGGQQSHVVVLATTRGAQLYLIFYLAPVNGFEVASVEDFQPMLNSFAFTR